MTATSRVCPVEACGTVIPIDEHLCHPHWVRLPAAIAKRVVRAYKDLRRGAPGAGAAYRAAVGGAVSALEGRDGRT